MAKNLPNGGSLALARFLDRNGLSSAQACERLEIYPTQLHGYLKGRTLPSFRTALLLDTGTSSAIPHMEWLRPLGAAERKELEELRPDIRRRGYVWGNARRNKEWRHRRAQRKALQEAELARQDARLGLVA